MSTYKRAPPPENKPAPNSLNSLTVRDHNLAAASAGPADNADNPQFNPVSKWQEPVDIPGLTLYDIHREPRRVNVDESARVRVQLKVGKEVTVYL